MKNLKIAGILAVVLLGLGLLATWDQWQTKKDEEKKAEETKLVDVTPDAVTEIAFRNIPDAPDATDDTSNPASTGSAATPGVPVEITMKKVDGSWRITTPIDARADDKAIENLLTTIRDYKFERAVAESKGSWDQYGLNSPRRSVRFTANGVTRSVFVGVNAPVGYNVYSATDASEKVFVGSQYLAVALAKSLHEFRDKTLATIDEATLKTFSYQLRTDPVINFEKGEKGFRLAAPAAMAVDPIEVRNLIDDVARAQVQEFMDAPDAAVAKAFAPDARLAHVTWSTEAGAKTELFFTEHNGHTLASFDPTSRALRLPDEFKTKIVRKLIDFRDRRVFAFDSNTLTTAEVDGNSYKFVGEDWYASADADKFDAAGKFTGNAEEKPSPQHAIRSLMVDLEFARADDIVAIDALGTQEKKLLESPPKHRIKLAFNAQSGTPETTIDAWTVEADSPLGNPQVARVVLRHSGRAEVFFVKPSLFEALSPQKAPTPNAEAGVPMIDDPAAGMEEAADLEASGLSN